MQDRRNFQRRLKHKQVSVSGEVNVKVDNDFPGKDLSVSDGLFDVKKLYSSKGFSAKEALSHIIDMTVRVTEWELIALK